MIVRRGIRREREVPLFRFGAQDIEHQAGLHACLAAVVVELDKPVQVLRAVDDERDVAALPRQASPTAAHGDRCAEPARRRDRLEDVLRRPWDDDTNGHLAIVGAVGRVQRTTAAVEPHFAADASAQLRLQRPCFDARSGASLPRSLWEGRLQPHRAELL